MYRYTFLAAMKYILSGCQNTQTSMQPFVTLSLLIKRNLQLFDRASPKLKIELLIVHLPSGCIGLLSYPGLVENLGVSQTLYTKMLVKKLFGQPGWHGPMLHTGLRSKMNDINILREDILQILWKYQLRSFSQKLISPTDPSQIVLT